MTNSLLTRRRLLTQALGGSTAAMLAGTLGSRPLLAHHSASDVRKVLVHVMLLGGADFRHLIAPAPGSAYANAFWQARRGLYQNPAYGSYAQCFNAEYTEVSLGGGGFGIHKNADWLRRQYNSGNVAIISNVFGSLNRAHDHSQLITMAGDLDADRLGTNRDGWGGRLAEAISDEANVVSLSGGVPIFCKGSDPAARLDQVVHASNTRDFSLPKGHGHDQSESKVLARALKSYYLGRGPSALAEHQRNWPFAIFFQHAAQIQAFGDQLDARLESHVADRPAAIQALYQGALTDRYWGGQCANLYDCMFATDILGMRVAHMEMGGWDTHANQQGSVDTKFSDIFGDDGGMKTVVNQLDQNLKGAERKLTFVFNSDFGRQLRANGGNGTDHGRANYSIVWGKQVNGGAYGELFPNSEISNNGNGQSPLETEGSDIEGRTSIERVFGALCDWVKPGTGDAVFPNRGTSALEFGTTMDFI
ncbi:MAG: DUF1501 domain-containing protein [Pseudomonadota bacterium]